MNTVFKYNGNHKEEAEEPVNLKVIREYARELSKQLEKQPETVPDITDSNIELILNGTYVNPLDIVEAPPVCLEIDSGERSIAATLGNFSAVIGKAKSRKTFFVSMVVAAFVINDSLFQQQLKAHLPAKQNTILYFDTEQSKYHLQKVVNRICLLSGKLTPDNLKISGLRKFKPPDRLKLIEHAIYNTPNLGFVVIDGLRDVVTSINDEEQATAITSKLLKWTEEKNIHILIVIHQNKGDTNARGHLGTEVINKAETVLSITKDPENKEVSIVEAEYCRDKDFTPFAFSVDSEGLPYFINHQYSKDKKSTSQAGLMPIDIPIETHQEILKKVFAHNHSPGYEELFKQIKLAFNDYGKKMGDNKAKDFLQWYQNEKYILKDKALKKYSLPV